MRSIPTEFYRIDWQDFGAHVPKSVQSRSLPHLSTRPEYGFNRVPTICSVISPSALILSSGPSCRAFRSLQESFVDDESITTLNEALDSSQERITDKKLTMEINASQSN